MATMETSTALLLEFLDVLVELIQVLSLDAELLFEFSQAMYAVSMRNDIPASESVTSPSPSPE